MEPFEIVAAPFTIYLAAPATPRPQIHLTPPAAWTLLGTSGNKSYTEAGVTVDMPQTLVPFRSLGGTGPRKFGRTVEDLTVSVEVMDLTPENLAKALDTAPITAQAAGAGVAGSNRVALLRGTVVNAYAVLIRGPSPYNELMNSQFWVPRMVIDGGPKVISNKGNEADVAFMFKAIEDVVDGFGAWEAANAAATS